MTLGDDLRPDQHVDLAFCHGANGGLGFEWAMQRVAGRDGDAGLREQAHEFFRNTLDARTAGDQAGFGATSGTFRRRRRLVAALVTAKPAAIAVLDQPGRTIAAHHLVAAALAERERCVAAAIEEQHRLFVGRERCGERFAQRLRQPASRFRPGFTKIDQFRLGHDRNAVPAG